MKNLTFKAAMLKGSQPTVNRRSTDGQSQRRYSLTPITKRWKVLMTLVFLFTFAIGNVWAADVTLFTADFSDAAWNGATFSQGNTNNYDVINGVTFHSKDASKKFSISEGVLTWPNNNMSSNNFYLGFPVTGINDGTITITVWNGSSATRVKYVIKNNADAFSASIGSSGTATSSANPTTVTITSLSTKAFVYLGRQGSGLTTITKIVVTTPAPSCDATVPGNISKGALNAGTLTLNAAGYGSKPAKNEWYWQTAEDGVDESNSGASFNVTAAGTYYVRSLYDNSCWSDAKSFTVTATDLVANYTVVYKDGTTELGNEVIAVASHPEGIADPKKDCYTFAGWMNGTTPVADVTAISGTKDEVITLTASWTPNYASGAYVFQGTPVTTSKTAATIFNGALYFSAMDATLDTGDASYYGWKIKTNNATVKFLVQYASEVKITLKEKSALNVTFTPLEGAETTETASKSATKTILVKAGTMVTLTTTTDATTTLNRIEIAPLYNATYTDGKGDASGSASNVTEVTLPTPSATTVDGYSFTGWVADKTVYKGETAKTAGEGLDAGETYTLTDNTAFTAQWQLISDFDVKFYQGYGEPDVQIGETQSISTGGHAVAPADPTRTGFVFLGWSYDATEAHIVDVAAYGITAATDFTAMWKAVWTVTFDGAGNVNVENGETVASPDSPTQAGKVFQGWYNGESKYDFSATVTGNLALISKWADADANHFYYNYKDDFHFDGVVYKTPEGKTTNPEADEATLNLTTPYILFSGAEGIEEIKVTNGIYDYKKAADTKHVTSYIKINTGGSSKIEFTIAAGYTAVLKMKMGGYSSDPTITLQKGDDVVAATSGEPGGKKASVENNFNEIVYDLEAGTYTMTTATKTLYISHIDLEATELPKYSVTYNAGTGAVKDGESMPTQADAYEGQVITLASGDALEKAGHIFAGWVATYNDGEEKTLTITDGKITMPAYAVTVIAQWEDNSKVAVIVETNVKYNDLAAAIEAAEPGQTVQLIQDINQEEAILIAKNLTLDLNNKTFTVTNPSDSYSNRAIKVTDGTIVIENGTVDALSNETHNSGCWGSLRQEGGHLTCNNVTFKNYRSGGLGLKPVGGTLILNECTVLSEFGGGLELGNATVEVNNCTFTQTGTDAQKIYGACFGMGKMGTLTINGGTYTSDNYSFYIYTSGGTINVNSGTFAGDIKTEMNNTQYPSAVGTINISGGTFDGVGENPIVFTAVTANDHISISGGVFDAPIAKEYCAVNYVPKDNGDGTYGVKPKDGVCLIKGNVDDNTFVIDEDASLLNGTPSKNNVKSKSSTYQTLTGWKFNARPAHLGLTLSEGTFQKGDVVEVFVTSVADDQGANDKMRVFTANDVTKMLVEGDADMVQGANRLTLPETTTNALYLVRGSENADYDMWNPYVAYFAVYRPMMPELTAITINDIAATKGTGNAFSITLPEEGTNLASLEVVPTIIRNAAHATTPEAVVSNEGAWKAGDNTYRVMDKDGDYTDYTITITLQGEAPAPDITTQPAGVAYCAGSEPTLEVEATGNELHYAWFKEAGETDEAVGEDAASYTIASAGTYYVIITNHVDGKLDKSVTSENAVVTLNVAAAITKQPTNKRDIALNSEVTLSVEATNATGYQWYICDDAEKHNASAISGAEAANYVFNCTANAYYYCVVGNACGEDLTSNVVSVKLEPEGCNTIASIPAAEPYQYEQTGEWTLYGIDSNGRLSSSSKFVNNAKDFNDNTVNAIADQRVGIIFEKDVESLTLYATSSSTGRTWKSDQQIRVTSDEITSGSPVYTNVTATREVSTMPDNTKQYIFTANDMIIPAGKKAWLPFSGNINIFKICYSTALAEPVLPTLSDQELCAGAAYEEFDATITNAAACEGTVAYKWYETTDTENPVATTAKFTPSTDGTYYVVVTHSAAGHITRTVQSDELSVAHFDALTLVSNSGDVFQHMGTAATLSVVATGKDVAYVWYTCSNAAGDDAVAIVPAETEASLAIASILEGVHYYKVVISHDCDATTLSHVFKVEGWNQLEQVDVTESTVWDMNNVSASEINLASMTPSKQNVLLLLANIEGVNNNASFNSQALMFEGQRIGRTENNVKYVSGQYVQFNVTVPGMVSVTFASNGSAQRTILINGKQCSRTTNDGTYIKYDVAVEPGSVEIEDVQGYVRISKIEFKAEYSRNRPGLNPANIGTLCWTNNAILGGATLYELAGKNENNKLVFDEVAENRLEAGKPYIFVPENGNTEIKLYNTDTEDALTQSDLQAVNGMHGTFVNLSSADGDLLGNYVISKNHYIYVDSDNVTLKAYRAYITSLDDVEPVNNEPAPINGAPRRRIVMGAQGEQVATGIDNLEASEKPLKLMIDGQMYILRGEKLFDATGRLVK